MGGFEQLKEDISGKANKRYIYGIEDLGYAWTGQVMGLIRDVLTVQELLERGLLKQRKFVASGLTIN